MYVISWFYRIARISADDYHHHVEDKIHKLISLDLINQIVYRVDLLFKLNPGVARKLPFRTIQGASSHFSLAFNLI